MPVSISTALPVIRNIEEAAELCHEFDAVITAGPEKSEVSGWGHPNHLVVSFDDVTDNRYGDAPTLEQVRGIVEWGANQVGSILIHCHAGISRSTSCAWGIAIAKGFDAKAALEDLLEAHPQDGRWGQRMFRPNSLIVSHLETIFGRKDLKTLVDKAIQRGW
ncbi:MAG: dual specificity protein phosphatase family protein [Ilumatobacteraceae bacterium]|nr:dual specificity protein phosphatase family protein [Ilumatobacteraceae bacterium]